MATPNKEILQKYPMYRYMTAYPIACEDIGKYTLGGFHPMNLGDLLCDGRYLIHQKLGWGGYSTVWIARDLYEHAVHRWVAVKIKIASVSSTEEDVDSDEDEEVRIHRHLDRLLEGEDDRGTRYLPRLLNWFTIKGPNGTHNCLVTELLGPSLSCVLESYEYNDKVFRPDTILGASRRLLKGIYEAHRAGYVHGDIAYSNVLFTCHDALDGDDEWLFSTMMNGDPHILPYDCPEIPWTPNFPRHIVEAPIWPSWEDDPSEQLRVVDWGSAFPISSELDDTRSELEPEPDSASSEIRFRFKHRHGEHPDMIAPERYLLQPKPDTKHDWAKQDLWKIGCIIYALFYQAIPFRYGRNPGPKKILDIMARKLRPLPEKEKWKGRMEELLREEGGTEHDVDRISTCNGPDQKSELIRDTFASRRQVIVTAFEEKQSGVHKTDLTFGTIRLWPSDSFSSGSDSSSSSGSDSSSDSDSGSDGHALDCLLPIMLGILQYDPDERMSAKEAISIIDQAWTPPDDWDSWTDEAIQNNTEEFEAA